VEYGQQVPNRDLHLTPLAAQSQSRQVARIGAIDIIAFR
jgi:hypothetical protein